MEFVCQFDVREILGQGSFCEVKRCIDKRTRRAFAAKELIYDTDEQRERIEQEIEVSCIQGYIVYDAACHWYSFGKANKFGGHGLVEVACV